MGMINWVSKKQPRQDQVVKSLLKTPWGPRGFCCLVRLHIAVCLHHGMVITPILFYFYSIYILPFSLDWKLKAGFFPKRHIQKEIKTQVVSQDSREHATTCSCGHTHATSMQKFREQLESLYSDYTREH